MLIDRKEAPARLLIAAEDKRSGSLRSAAGAGAGRAAAADMVCIVPSTARTPVASKTVRRCCNIKNPTCSSAGILAGKGLTPDVGDVRNFGSVLRTADFRGSFRPGLRIC